MVQAFQYPGLTHLSLQGNRPFFWGGEGRLKGDAGVGGSRPVCDECVNFRAPGLSRGQLLPWALQGLSTGTAVGKHKDCHLPSGRGLGPLWERRGAEGHTCDTSLVHPWGCRADKARTPLGYRYRRGTGEFRHIPGWQRGNPVRSHLLPAGLFWSLAGVGHYLAVLRVVAPCRGWGDACLER